MSEANNYSVEPGRDLPAVRVPQLETRRERRERSLAAVAQLAATHAPTQPEPAGAESQPTEVVFSDEVPLNLHRRLIALSSTDPQSRASETQAP